MEWPPLPYADWRPTKETVHRSCQVLGKLRMALVPPRNHWWHVTLYVTERGLTTGPMPVPGGELAVALDLLDHRLLLTRSDGRTRSAALTDDPAVGAFHARLFAALAELDVPVSIDPSPFDLPGPPLAADREHATYDPDAVWRWWRVLARTQRVLDRFRGGFTGKASPVHVFWHSLDLAYARFSGRPAPLPHGVDPVTAEAYSHEIVAFGFWPGDDGRTPYPAFYSYTAPEPAGLRDQPLGVEAAEWQDTGNGSLAVLAYDAVREARDPDATLLAFFAAAYRAGATAAGWDVAALGR